MDIRIGDKVRFLTETGGGKVVKIVDSKTVMVYSEEFEFEIPASVNDLVVIESDFDTESDEIMAKVSDEIKEVEPIFKASVSNKIYLAFLSKNHGKSGSDIDCYVVNDTNNIIFYTFYEERDDKMNGISGGNCNPGEKMFLETYTVSDIDNIKKILLQLLSFKKQGCPEQPIEFKLNLNPVKFFKNSSYKNNEFFDTPALLFEITSQEKKAYKLEDLTENNTKKLKSVKEKMLKRELPVIDKKNEPMEVDLHINSLIDSVVGLSNSDILEYQLNKFHEVMETYKFRKGKKIVFIHGIGNGTLKQKVLWELKHKYKKHKHQDASFQQYGYGATMVTM